jgi:hypothetical protein
MYFLHVKYKMPFFNKMTFLPFLAVFYFCLTPTFEESAVLAPVWHLCIDDAWLVPINYDLNWLC